MYTIPIRWIELGGRIDLSLLFPTKEMNQILLQNSLTQGLHVMGLCSVHR